MSNSEILKKIKSGGFQLKETTGGADYEPVLVTIKECNVDEARNLSSDSPLIQKMDDDQVAIQFFVNVKFEDGDEYHAELLSGFLTKSNQIALYPSYKDKPASLLYDIKKACEQYSTKQFDLLDGAIFNEKMFKGLKFNYEAKRIEKDGETFVILKTSWQIKKDLKREQEMQEEAENGALDSFDDDETTTETTTKGKPLPF